jgi:polar amino acid transport system substrate-binding protein
MKSRYMNTCPSFHRRLVTLGALAALALSLNAHPGMAEGTLDKIKKSGTVSVGTAAVYAPFEFVADGKLAGFDIELANEIFRRMGVTASYENIDFKGIIAALKSSRIDMIVAAMTTTPDRVKQMAFTIPFYDAGIGAAKRKGTPIAEPQDLNGRIVGVQLGTSGESFVRERIKAVKEMKTYDSILLALKDLDNGRLDAVVNPLPPIRYNIRALPNVEVTKVWDSRVVGFNTRLDDQDLLAEINRHIETLKTEGFIDRLDKKWF